MQSERSPVAEGNGDVMGLPVLVLEPGTIGRWLGIGCAACAGKDFAVTVTVTYTGQNVADELAASPTAFVVMPPAGSVFSHLPEKFTAFLRLQHALDFGRAG